MNMLNTKNKLYTVFNNFVNIFSFNSKKLSVVACAIRKGNKILP